MLIPDNTTNQNIPDCIGCGKSCYSQEGIPCKYLSNTQQCQIYNIRLNADCGNGCICGLRQCKIFQEA